MKKKTEKEKIAAIVNVLKKRDSSDVPVVEKCLAIKDLDREVRLRIVGILAHEFAQHGLLSTDEPNTYGLEIEDLIDYCGVSRDG